ncbi:aldo/keto reductase [Paenibacillus allorhizosphaerae]|uniref:Aldo-keto reductase IolS n=1 Tax=Paenibacillus allorhizosphaerae TaxID=2849866 RepID=A0ABM8VFA5_9BACL|nr:aldo/keto reductase [Paenibacillus allorhizosphaerae]CAG7634184.1 Aldo-keto reductase IolS [Paenibacillus allorhizosphaerae]
MKYRRLGKTNLKVSVIGVGTWQFGGEWGKTFTQAEADAILDQAKESGINLIDTAECYGDHTSESLIGDYISRGRREDWVIATKFGHHFHGHQNRTPHYSAREVLAQLEASLQSLRTDYIDVYQFHSGPDEAFDQDELWTMLDKQVQAGKIRHLGTSIGSNDNLHQTDTSEKVGSQVIQVVYNRLDRKPEERVFPSCERQDLGVLARVPLASGYLSGKYKPGATFSDNDVRQRHDPQQTLAKLQEVERIREREVPEGMDMATWALAWCLKHPAVTAVIPGCKSPEQVISNAAAANYVGDGHPQNWNKANAEEA